MKPAWPGAGVQGVKEEAYSSVTEHGSRWPETQGRPCRGSGKALREGRAGHWFCESQLLF